MQKVEIPEDLSGQRLDKYLRRALPGAGTGFLYRMLRKKNIVLNGQKAAGNEILCAGDEITFWLSDETIRGFSREAEADSAPGFDPAWILFEDEDLLVINKPAGLLSQRARKEDISLVELLRGYLTETGAEQASGSYVPGVLNRLDRNTSGLVLAAKTLAGARTWSEILSGHAAQKEYLALVSGCWDYHGQHIAYLTKDERTNRVQVSESESPGAKQIVTKFHTLACEMDFTLVLVELVTGRSHQIRAHLAYLGHPVLGDPKYGTATRDIPRQMLHAWRLSVPDERTGKERTFAAPIPQDMARILADRQIDTGVIDQL